MKVFLENNIQDCTRIYTNKLMWK